MGIEMLIETRVLINVILRSIVIQFITHEQHSITSGVEFVYINVMESFNEYLQLVINANCICCFHIQIVHNKLYSFQCSNDLP